MDLIKKYLVTDAYDRRDKIMKSCVSDLVKSKGDPKKFIAVLKEYLEKLERY